jgi:hypothetical protein
MKSFLRSALVMGAIVGTSALASGVATAGVSIGIGVPAVVIGASPGYVAYDDQYYYDPIYISGAWYHGPYRWRMRGGERVFFVNGRWHRNEWRESRVPASIVFHNGGSFRDGRYDGFDGAARINARFHVNGNNMREGRRDVNNDRANMQHDRKDMRQDPNDAMPQGREDKSDAPGDSGDSH